MSLQGNNNDNSLPVWLSKTPDPDLAVSPEPGPNFWVYLPPGKILGRPQSSVQTRMYPASSLNKTCSIACGHAVLRLEIHQPSAPRRHI